MLLTALHYALSRGRDGIHYSWFTDSRLRGEFSVTQAGLHHPPALLYCAIAYYSSSSPIRPSIHSLAVRTWAMDASLPLWKKVQQAALPGQEERTRQR